MITLPDLDRLLRALPERSALLMVGDADQLPPVGLGQPFADLVGRVPTVRLQVTRRQDKGATGILEAARRALEGEPLREVLIKRPPDLLYRKVGSPEEATRLVVELAAYYLKQGLSLWEFQVLTPIHAGPLGTQALNALVRSVVPKERSRPLELSGGVVAYVGDKIIFDENKPLLGVMNGTMGIVRVVGEDTFLLDTGEDLKELPKGVAAQASLGYAITVHRSQGSEWPAVILVLPESPLSTRKVVYTALTRAKRQAVLLSLLDLENRPLPKDRRRRTYLGLVAPEEGEEG
jgi:ATP-dependent exoDNAse (exonuclease V) alpha subunit